MARYSAKRLLEIIPTLLGVISLVFVILRLIPGDPTTAILGDFATPERISAVRSRLGLDQPVHRQYVSFLLATFRGDFGTSMVQDRSVLELLKLVYPHTVWLTLASVLVTVAVGVPLGVIAAKHRNSLTDLAVLVAAMVGVASPTFWLGLLALWLFSGLLGWFPLTGAGQGGHLLNLLHHLALPSVVLGLSGASLTTRMTRSCLLEVLGEDYIRTARAKGAHELHVLYHHALRNAVIPVVTIVGLNMGHLLGGAVLVESVFARPGLGKLLVDAIFARDYPVVQGVVALFAVTVMLINLAVDLAYGVLDPRIAYE